MIKSTLKFRLPLIVLALFAMASLLAATDSNTMPRLTIPFTHKGHVVTNFPWIAEAAESHPGLDNLILMEPMTSASITNVFPGSIALRCFTIDAGCRKGPKLNTLLIIDDLPAYVNGDATAANVISVQRRRIAKAGDAVELVNVFADLRHFVPQYAEPTKATETGAPWGKADWTLVTEETSNVWVVACSFLCWNDPPRVRRYNRYRFKVDWTGTITVLENKPLLHEGGYL